ncbi:MAG: GT4 family glycosyltransferase PelF [Anaerolineae bacterium]|nr:GT4 family glycosyltransferase PelF [Anaerolineae bacterium]
MLDVCLILEGTYPYLVGGVSAWVQTLLTGLPDLTFGLVHLSADEGQAKQPQYPFPPNLRQFVDWPLDLDPNPRCPEDTYITLNANLPQARVYHALSTGFAGMLGCQVKKASGRPLILTEHGIYWREVEVGSTELECGFRVVPDGQHRIDLQSLRHHWRVKLQDMAQQTYRQADAITTVCRANARLQTTLGAPSSRSQVISNSVDWPALAPSAFRSPAGDGVPRIGFVGRVVSIKDVLTFINACQLVAAALPQAEFYVIGPLHHDPAYVARCRALAADLGLADRLTFTGETDSRPWYRRLDAVVLTSVSEGQPLVLLEAMAAGTPIVTTAVGGCPELVLGASSRDQKLGPAGYLTPVGNPQATASAILNLCRNKEYWQQASAAGQERARRYYSTGRLCRAYRALYNKFIN